MRVTYLLAAAAVVAAVPLGLLGVEYVAAQREAARRAASHDALCFARDPFARQEGGARIGVVAVGVLGVRRFLRAGARECYRSQVRCGCPEHGLRDGLAPRPDAAQRTNAQPPPNL